MRRRSQAYNIKPYMLGLFTSVNAVFLSIEKTKGTDGWNK